MDAEKKFVVTEHSKGMEDIMSLNEYICYEEDEIRCEELADISDYGDDDQEVPSELPSLPSSSEIGEEMEEEGEGGFGNVAGVESSSSHGDVSRKKTKKSGSKHDNMKKSKMDVSIYDASKESFYPYDGDKTTSRDVISKKSKLRKRKMPEGDQVGDTIPESVDEPKGKLRRKRPSKTGAVSDSDGVRDNAPISESRKKRTLKTGTGSDSDGKKEKSARIMDDEDILNDSEKSEKEKIKKRKLGKDRGAESTEESEKETSQTRDKEKKKKISKEKGEKRLDEKTEGSDTDTRRGKETMKEQGREGGKKQITYDDKKKIKESDDDKESTRQGDPKRKRQDEQELEKQVGKEGGKVADKEKVKQGKIKESEQEKGKQPGQDRGRQDDRGRQADRGRQDDREKLKQDEKSRSLSKSKKGDIEKENLDKGNLEKDKLISRTDEMKKKFDEDMIGGVDSRDMGFSQHSNINIAEKEQEKSQKKFAETINESKIFEGKKIKTPKKRDDLLNKESKMKMNELQKDSKLKLDEMKKKKYDEEKKNRYLRKLDNMMMDEKMERKDSEKSKKRLIQSRDQSIDQPIYEEAEEKKPVIVSAEKDKVERPKKQELLLIEKERREIEEMKKQRERAIRQEKQKRRELDADRSHSQKQRLTNESILDRYDRFSSLESFRASYGELFLQKNENVINYEGFNGLLDETDAEMKQESPSEATKKRKGKKGKGKKKKAKVVKKETQIICNFEPKNFAFEGWNKKKKICRRQTVDDICCSVLNKQKCKQEQIDMNMDEEHIQLSSSRDGRYPGFNECPTELITIQSRTSSYNSFLRLFRAAFQCTDRVLVQTTWNNFVVFRYCDKKEKAYYLYCGCTCNLNRFRHLDLRCGTAGLTRLLTIHDIITTIRFYRKPQRQIEKERQEKIDGLLKQYTTP